MSNTLPPVRIAWRDLLDESIASLVQRPSRSLLASLGIMLGVGAFVIVLGMTSTVEGQVNQQFNVLAATTVTVTDVGSQSSPSTSFPVDADKLVRRIDGVVSAGVTWQVPGSSLRASSSPWSVGVSASGGAGLQLTAADPGALAAMGARIEAGRLYGTYLQNHEGRVAVLGALAAQELGITTQLAALPAVFVDGGAYTVVGIASNFTRSPQGLLSIYIPSSTALRQFGPPTNPAATMDIVTRLGAAPVVARQVALALRPDDPGLFQIVAPANPTALQGNVKGALNGLVLLLAGIMLVIGATSIVNTTLVSVLERTSEIGLRRALGARGRSIALQFLTESMVLGGLGGIVGTATGVLVVLITAVLRGQAAVLPPWAVLPALVVGTVVGLLSGIYPALRASRIEPVAALEH